MYPKSLIEHEIEVVGGAFLSSFYVKMSAGKRPASNSFGSSQMVVKRQKSNTDINGKDLAITGGGKDANGALIQAVSLEICTKLLSR